MDLLARLLHAYTGQHIKINYIFLYTKTKMKFENCTIYNSIKKYQVPIINYQNLTRSYKILWEKKPKEILIKWVIYMFMD